MYVPAWVNVHHIHVWWRSEEDIRQISWNWGYGWFWYTIWGLEIKPERSARATNALVLFLTVALTLQPFFFFKGRILYGWEDIPVGKSIFFYKLENLNSNSWHPYKQLGMETGRPEVLTGSQNRTSSSVRDSVSRLKCIPAHSRAPNGICTHTYIYIHTPHTFPEDVACCVWSILAWNLLCSG